MIADRIVDLQKAIQALHEEAHDLQPSEKREVALNVVHYIKQDLKMLLHKFGVPE